MAPPLLREHAHVVLHGTFWPQVGIAYIGVVQVIERGHAVAALGESPQRQPLYVERPQTDKQRRRTRAQRLRRTHVAGMVLDPYIHERSLYLEAAEVGSRSHRHVVGVSVWISEARKVGIELVPLEVVACRQAPPPRKLIHVGPRHVHLLLAERVIDMHLRGVVVDVARVVVGILGEHLGGEPPSYRLLGHALHEGVMVPLPLATPPHIAHYGPRYAALGVVGVCLHAPQTMTRLPVDVALHPERPHITVVAHGGGVVGGGALGRDAAVAELIPPARREHAGTQRRAYIAAETLLPQRGEAESVARAILDTCH